MSAAVKEHERKGFGKRSEYAEIHEYRTRREFNVWWEVKKQEGWRLNTRYDSARGQLTEYWHCSHKQEGIYTCPARLKFFFARTRFKVFEAKNRPHDHTLLPQPNNPLNVPKATILEPFPMQTAQIVDLTPRIVASTIPQSSKNETIITCTTTEQTQKDSNVQKSSDGHIKGKLE